MKKNLFLFMNQRTLHNVFEESFKKFAYSHRFAKQTFGFVRVCKDFVGR